MLQHAILPTPTLSASAGVRDGTRSRVHAPPRIHASGSRSSACEVWRCRQGRQLGLMMVGYRDTNVRWVERLEEGARLRSIMLVAVRRPSYCV